MYTYCEITAQKVGFFSSKISINVDFGQGDPSILDLFKGKTNKLKDEDSGKVKKFNSVVDALNYMSGNGWEYVNCMVVTSGKDNVYHYIMRKELE